MARWVALLRSINVGGHVVTMERLRALFEELGLANVETFIASGNVIFDSPSRSPRTLERTIEAHLASALGYEVATFLRTPAELAAVAALEPFGASDERTLYVTFLREPPGAAWVERVMSFRSDVDDFRVVGREMYWACRIRSSDSRYGKARPDKDTPATVRQMTTVKKLAQKLTQKLGG